jgi:hypothetical protein
LATELLGFGRKAAPLVIVKPQTRAADLVAQDSVLLHEVVDDVLLMLIHPSRNRHDHKRTWVPHCSHFAERITVWASPIRTQ